MEAEQEALAFLEEFELLDDGLALLEEDSEVVEGLATEQEPLQWPAAAEDDASRSDRDSTKSSADTCDLTSKKKKARPRKVSANSNRARNVRREELVYLRGQVSDLESQLEELQKHDSSKRLCPGAISRAMVTHPSDQREMQVPVWAEIASRQYAARQQVELKNIRLKMLLESQIKVGRGLEKLLNNRSNTQVRVLAIAWDRIVHCRAVFQLCVDSSALWRRAAAIRSEQSATAASHA